MRWTSLALLLILALLVGACHENSHEGSVGWPPPYREDMFDPWPYPSDGAAPVADAGPADDVSSIGDAGSAPQCTTFITLQGAVCVSCTTPTSTPVVSCSAGPPTTPSTCHSVQVDGFTCQVCHDPAGKLLSASCSNNAAGGCATETDGDDLCLVCVDPAGTETSRRCVPQSKTCKAVTFQDEVCIECLSASGKTLSKQCADASQSCQEETVQGKLCVVCRDGAGEELSKLCEGEE